MTGAGPSGPHVSVELSDDDMRAMHTDWETKSVPEKFRLMAATGDLLVVDYLRVDGRITDEFYRGRVREIRSRYVKKEHS